MQTLSILNCVLIDHFASYLYVYKVPETQQSWTEGRLYNCKCAFSPSVCILIVFKKN